MRVRPLSEEAYLTLVRTAKRTAPATIWLKGGQVLDVYTKVWRTAHVVISGERIAYVGHLEPLVDEQTEIIDVSGYYLVPGYIEPHAHPMQWYNPAALSDYALKTGTTMMVSDTLALGGVLDVEKLERLMERLGEHPVKSLFWARLDAQTTDPVANARFTEEYIARTMSHPQVIQGGELTNWGAVLSEQPEMMFGLKYAGDIGKRMEGHHPGASKATLAIAAAAGVTACHESISAEDVLNRLQLGFYATLRHSSIRPDLPDLVKGLQELGVAWSPRMMLTTDGSTPAFMREGFMDMTIRVAIAAGMPAEEAYAMASLNPAVYYGLDSELGGIAPGRIADINVLVAPDNPTPQIVIANGRKWVEGGKWVNQPPVLLDEEVFNVTPINDIRDLIKPDWFRIRATGETMPIMQMLNAVITKVEMVALPTDEAGYLSIEHDPELAYIMLIDQQGKKLSQAIVRGYASDLEALVTTYHISDEYLVMGRDPQAMEQALRHLIEIGGGIVVRDGGEVAFAFAFAYGGKFPDVSMEESIAKGEAFDKLMRAKGYVHLDPIYSLLFFTATHLPYVRITKEGLYDVKAGKVICPSVKV